MRFCPRWFSRFIMQEVFMSFHSMKLFLIKCLFQTQQQVVCFSPSQSRIGTKEGNSHQGGEFPLLESASARYQSCIFYNDCLGTILERDGFCLKIVFIPICGKYYILVPHNTRVCCVCDIHEVISKVFRLLTIFYSFYIFPESCSLSVKLLYGGENFLKYIQSYNSIQERVLLEGTPIGSFVR